MIRFGDFQLDPSQGLARGGQDVHLTPKAFAILCVLTERRRVLVEERGGSSIEGEPTQVILGIPDDVRRVIERQLERLDARGREILRVASVVGVESSAAEVAAGTGEATADVEETLARLSRQNQFVTDSGTEAWPDGTVAARFAFQHSLYREVLSATLSGGRRAELHARVGLRLEAAYLDRTADIAAELAAHFDEGHDSRRAVMYLQSAAHTGVRRSALKEAQRNFERGLSLLQALPASTERTEREIALRIGIGGVLMATKGWGAPEVESMYTRARELCRQLGDTPQVFPALWGLWLFYWGRGSLETAKGLADDLLALATGTGDRALLLQAHHAQWATAFSIGDLRGAHQHASDGAALYVKEQHFPLAASYGNHDAAVCARAFDGRHSRCSVTSQRLTAPPRRRLRSRVTSGIPSRSLSLWCLPPPSTSFAATRRPPRDTRVKR